MQVMISFIDRKTNLLVCSTFFDISKIKDLDLSPRQIYNYIWENAKPYGAMIISGVCQEKKAV